MLEIEIVDSNIIEGGIEVFARAWRDGKQLGFGKDGTVDIERFRIFNPPILVDDPNGDIVIDNSYTDIDGNFVSNIRALREDPEQAIVDSLFNTISVMKNIHDDSKIIPNKRGNTTSTCYAGGGDGGILGYQTESTPTEPLWDQLHDATTLGGTTSGLASTSASSGDTYVCRTVRKNITNGLQIGRSFFPIDTSALPDTDDISSAVFSVYGFYVLDAITLGLVQTSQASTTALALSDWDTCGDAINNPTEGASRVAINSTSARYWDWTLNANGIGWISKTGTTKLGLRTEEDIDDSYPTVTTDRRFNTYYSESAGTANDPKLVVEHAAGGSPTVYNALAMCNF